MQQKRYDYIITGIGCAGLSLAVHLINSGQFTNKKILLVDEVSKEKNDRTWCFWEEGKNLFDAIVYHSWEDLWFYGEDFSKQMNISPYRYKMIRGLDFYDYCLKLIKKQANFELMTTKVEKIFSEKETGISINGQTIYAEYIFNSILFERPVLQKKEIWLLQHFKGWVIETKKEVFKKEVATLMDFRINQQHGTSFCYVLPFSKTKALVEYTLFTPSLLEPAQYDEGLKTYLEEILHLTDYRIMETEFGLIPMTDHRFTPYHNNIINLGTAGGQTKGSSGYTFYFIQQHSKAIVESLLKTGMPFTRKTSWRFPFYDKIFLQVLIKNKFIGKKIFTLFFKKNTPQSVLRFLNNASTLAEEMKTISSLPTLTFLRAALERIF